MLSYKEMNENGLMGMMGLVDRIILLLGGGLLMSFNVLEDIKFVYILIGVITVCITFYCSDYRNNVAEIIIYMAAVFMTVPFREYIYFVPIIIYTFVYKYLKRNIYVWSALAVMLTVCIANVCEDDVRMAGAVFFLMALSIVMAFKTKRIVTLRTSLRRQRDDSIEKNIILSEKNKFLAQNQEKEVHIAILSERNRIAREIHDNVGHMLSRAILQIGAIMAVSGDDTKSMIMPVRNTMNEAMNSIRESVHDLHKESFDLEAASRRILEELDGFKVRLDCEMSEKSDKNVKYTFLTILKEAVNNIGRHCDGDHVDVLIRELDDYYQMVIEDNGTRIQKNGYRQMEGAGAGIGLINMRQRVEDMRGIINFSCENGFRIFISIPKQTDVLRNGGNNENSDCG